MEILFYNKNISSPKVSIILLDWSCRESFHILRYLSCQTIPREDFEVIWIEYYDRRSPQIEDRIKGSEQLQLPPPVDQWMVMDIARNVYFHKHLMYNIGIIAARGKIVTICDSDAIVNPTFVESIINSFQEARNIFLHMDEVRSNDRRFYPFNYPSLKEVLDNGRVYLTAGKTTPLFDDGDTLHTQNYGACMSALREDLVNIGGSDEHVDYLGHICGPYEMTFRLVNAGKREVWHQDELLYHVWHPGQAGHGNYLGPHDGRHMSTTALQVRTTGRILPLVENSAIRMLRLKQKESISEAEVCQAIQKEEMENWTVERLEERLKKKLLPDDKSPSRRLWEWEPIHILKIVFDNPKGILQILVTLSEVLIKQIFKSPGNFRRISREVYRTYLHLTNTNRYNAYVMERCKSCLAELASDGISEIALYGTTDVAGMFCQFTLHAPVRIKAVYDHSRDKTRFGLDVMPVEAIKQYHGKIIITTFVDIETDVKELRGLGVRDEQMIIL